MNYIPGFTNYLQASVPRFAKGGPARFVEDVMYLDNGDYGSEPYAAPFMPAAEQSYIPGFSNYLEASAAPYAEPAQYMPTAQPTTTEAVPAVGAAPDYNADFLKTLRAAGMSEADIANLSNFSGFAPQPSTGGGLEGLNFGLALPADYKSPYGEVLITAPTSNKGNPTAYGANNQFYMYPDNFVRVVDRSTNSVVFEGTGIDAARKAVEIGQNLTDTMGRKADYQIQTGNTQDNYQPVANEKYNKSTVSKIANVAGTVLPLAMMAIPGVNAALLGTKLAATTAGQIAFGALTGAASSGLKGQNVLKGAALGGLSAAGGALIPKIPAISDLGNLAKPLGVGIGATAGGLATGQDLKNSLLGGVASGALAYAAPSIQDAFKGIGAAPSTGGNAAPVTGGPNAPIIVSATPSFSAPINLGGYKTPAQKAVDEIAKTTDPTTATQYADDIIKVTGQVPGASTPSINFSGDTTGLPPVRASGLDAVAEPTPEEILVNARKTLIPSLNVDLSTVPTGALSTVAEPTPEEILVNARKTFTPPVNFSVPTTPPGGTDVVDDIIKVTGRRTEPGPPVNVDLSTTPPGGLDTVTPTELEEILVNARKTLTPSVNVDLSTVPTGGLDTLTAPELKEILVKGRETLTPSLNVDLSTVPTGGLDTVTPAELEEILVKGRETLTPSLKVDLSTTPPGGTDVVDDTIKVTGRRTEPGPSIIIDTPPAGDDTKKVDTKEEEDAKKKKLGVEEYLRLAALAAGLIGGGGGKGQTGYYGGGGSGRLNSIFSAKLPAAGGLGTIGAARTARPMGDVDWLTYGTRPELDFFDYAPRTGPAPVTTPVPGNPAGPIMATPAAGMIPAPEQILTPAQLAALEKQRLDQYAYLSQFTPTAEELARNTALYGNNEAADPIMTADEPRPMMAKGGAFAAKRGGRSQRTEFAVNGPGTGRSDDIPAVLSDGEYVIDAETVALLGDGSSKAGAKKLDELRVKIRKHKGQKLAKGRFSANAKRPEAYLSGGRV